VCVCFVDDCLFCSKKSDAIDQVIDDLQSPNPTAFKLKVESDVAGFLGILMKKSNDGLIELLQTSLIDWILKVMGLKSSMLKCTPTKTKPLGKDENGNPCVERWSYSSVVGMMMYLASNS
jgi:hypothetical protein